MKVMQSSKRRRCAAQASRTACSLAMSSATAFRMRSSTSVRPVVDGGCLCKYLMKRSDVRLKPCKANISRVVHLLLHLRG